MHDLILGHAHNFWLIRKVLPLWAEISAGHIEIFSGPSLEVSNHKFIKLKQFNTIVDGTPSKTQYCMHGGQFLRGANFRDFRG